MARRRTSHGGSRSPAGGHAATLVFFVTFLAFPFYWMLITTFKTTQDLHDTDQQSVSVQRSADARPPARAVRGYPVPAVARSTPASSASPWWRSRFALAVPAGYALARMTGAWAQTLGIAIFLTYLVPPTILFIPFARIIAVLGLQDSLWSLVLVYPSFTVPFCTWLLMGFFKAIPRDLEDAAMIDGLSRFGAFVKVVMPISLAGMLTAVIFAFTLVTQEFVYGVTFITSSSQLHGERRRADLPGARRRLFLGLDDGRLPDRQRADRDHLQFLRRPLRRRLHRRRGEVA